MPPSCSLASGASRALVAAVPLSKALIQCQNGLWGFLARPTLGFGPVFLGLALKLL